MVNRARYRPQTDKVKAEAGASSSLPPKDYAPWSAPPSMMMSHPESPDLSSQHYATIYLDHEGQIKSTASPSVRRHIPHIFSPDLQERFLQATGLRFDGQNQLQMSSGEPRSSRRPSFQDNGDSYSPERMTSFSSDGAGSQAPSTGSLSSSWDPVRPMKRRNDAIHNYDFGPDASDIDIDCGLDDPSLAPLDQIHFQIGDGEALQAYMYDALVAFQQTSCKAIAKPIIKMIEPRKQVKYPYNGGKPPPGSPPGTKGDPEKTKPRWWPLLVQHKEPDHLGKSERIELLWCLLHEIPKEMGISVDQLEEAGREAARQLKPQHREILEEIYRVRRFEERYERGEIEGTALIGVVDRSRAKKLSRKGKKKGNLRQGRSAKKSRNSESPSESSGSSGPVSAPSDSPNSPIHYMSIGITASRDVPMSDDRTPTFQMPCQMGFGGQVRSSQSVGQPQATPNAVSPCEQPSVDYLSHSAFVPPVSSSPQGQQHLHQQQQHNVPQVHHRQAPLSTQQQANGNFDAWSSPFQTNLYNPTYPGHPIHHQQPLLQQQQVPMLQNNALPQPRDVHHPHQTHPGHHTLPDLHNSRTPEQFEALSLGAGGSSYRTGST